MWQRCDHFKPSSKAALASEKSEEVQIDGNIGQDQESGQLLSQCILHVYQGGTKLIHTELAFLIIVLLLSLLALAFSIYRYANTVWIFQDFSISQILREINFEDSWSAKSDIFPHSEALNFDFYEFLHFLKAEIDQLNKIHSP